MRAGSIAEWNVWMRHQSTRQLAGSAPLNTRSILKVVRPLFRRRNDYSQATLDELPSELSRFGILTIKYLRLLMKKHRRALLVDEKIRMSRAETLWLHQEIGPLGLDMFSENSWYAIPGLVRQAMEFEFGEKAAIYVTEQKT